MGKKNVSLKRWQIAQNSEKDMWTKYKHTLPSRKKGYSYKTKILVKEWSNLIKINKNTRILQIGCGPLDIINFIKIGKKYSIDPLANFYKKNFSIDYKSTRLQKGVGESLPFPDKYFDIVILANVLDHAHLPKKVIQESKRVLKNNGIFHFENNYYQKTFLLIAKMWGFFKEKFLGQIFNIHHPYMLTLSDLKKLISNDFETIQDYLGRRLSIGIKNLREKRRHVIKNEKLIRKILALFGLYGTASYTAICKKC